MAELRLCLLAWLRGWAAECQADVSGALFDGCDLTNASFHAGRLEKASTHTYMQAAEPSRRVHARTQASFANAKLHNADWTHALIGEYPSLLHDSEVTAVAVHGAMTVTGCKDGKVRIWREDQVPYS